MHCFKLIKPGCPLLAFNVISWAEYEVLIVQLLIKTINAEPQ